MKRPRSKPKPRADRRETHKSLRWLTRERFLAIAAAKDRAAVAKYLAAAPHDHDHIP